MTTGKRIDLPERLGRWRERAKLSQYELARRIGVTRACVSLWEKGRTAPRWEILERTCDALGITMAQFWGRAPRRLQPVEAWRR